MSFKSIFSIALVSLGLAMSVFSGSVWAQDANTPPLKIVIVNIEAVRAQSTAYKMVNEQFVKYSNEINTALQKEDKDLRAANDELARKRSLLSPEAFSDERKKHEQRIAAFQRKVQARQKAMANSQAEALGKINRKIVEIISQYAEANKVTLVLPESVTVLAAKSLNINKYVLDNLNKTLASVQVTKPAK